MSIAMAPELVRTLRLRLRSDDHEAVREARRTLASALGDAADAAMTVPELVLGELIGNATRYAPGAVDLLMHVGDEAVSISVTDGGAGFSLEPPAPRTTCSPKAAVGSASSNRARARCASRSFRAAVAA